MATRNTGFRMPQICIQLYGHLTCYCTLFQFLASFLSYFNQIVASAILTLLTFLQLKYNDRAQSVFATHRAPVLVAVVSSVVYFSAYAALLRFPLHSLSFLAHRLVVLSGYVSVASLASLLLTDAAAFFVFAVFGFVLAAEMLLFWEEEDDDDAEFWIGRNGNGLLNNIFGGGLAPRLPI